MGTYAITAVYNGDSGDTPSSATTTFTVGPDATTTVAGPSTFSPVSGEPLSLNAIVAVKSPGSGTPTGTVTFKYGSKVVGTATLVTINGLTYASLPLPPLGPATYTFTAVYNGDSGDLPSSGLDDLHRECRPRQGSRRRPRDPGAEPGRRSHPGPRPGADRPPSKDSARAGNRIVQGQPERAWLDALDSLDAER